MNIQLISREAIDTTKWNSCVHYATNGNIFGYKWYIDAVTKDWEALVEGDYESVLPLIWKKNWLGKKRLYVPTLIREAGIYSSNALSEKRVASFLKAIPATYKKWTIQVDQFTLLPKKQLINIKQGKKQLIYMNKSYEQLSDRFTPVVHTQLDKARAADLRPAGSLKPESIVDFYKANDPNYSKENYYAYLRIMYNLLHRGWGFISGVVDANKTLLAVNFFIFSHGRLVSYLPVVSKQGQAVGAMEFLMNLIFHTNANKQLILDFNGNPHIGLGEEVVPFYEISKI